MYVKFVKAEFDVWSIIIGPDLSKHNSSVTRLVTKTLSNIIWFSNFLKLYNVPSYFPIWGISKVHKRRINTIYFRFKPICGWCWSQSKEVAEMSVMSEHFIFSKLCLLISCAGPGPVPRGEERGGLGRSDPSSLQFTYYRVTDRLLPTNIYTSLSSQSS